MLTDIHLLFVHFFGVLHKSSEKPMSKMASMMKHVQLYFGGKVIILYSDDQHDWYEEMKSL